MYAVCVDLKIKPGLKDTFLPHMIENAEMSLKDEPGCVQFDVCVMENDPELVVLYELYKTKEDFSNHLNSKHFLRFDAQTANMIAQKLVRTGYRFFPSQAG
ncbi:MAG: putative quinol monooxygenase [Aliishimia sp.]